MHSSDESGNNHHQRTGVCMYVCVCLVPLTPIQAFGKMLGQLLWYQREKPRVVLLRATKSPA